MTDRAKPRIKCSTETRAIVRAQKRGGEAYDDLLQKMVEQYDPMAHEPGDGDAIGGKNTKLPCAEETREAVRAQKRGGETYDELLRKMADAYDPEKAASDPLDRDTAETHG